MNIQNYTNYLMSTIKPWAKIVSGGREINCRCMYCADSKTMSHGHFYIKIPLNEEDISVFNCVKCHAAGVVTPEKIIEWGLSFDGGIIQNIADTNQQYKKKNGNKFSTTTMYNLWNPLDITEDDLTKFKLKYISNRLGFPWTLRNCIDNKIILNLNDLLKVNHLNGTRDPRIIQTLDSNFIGFISYDNAFCNMRNLDIGEVYKTINKRYINYNIYDQLDNTRKFYLLPTTIYPNSLNPIKIHIAEGPFDILSIKYNISKEIENNIYIGITGSGYKGILRFLLTELGLINIELHLYPDNDMKENVIYDLCQFLYPFPFPIYKHSNIYPGEKDFGVPINRIDMRTERIR